MNGSGRRSTKWLLPLLLLLAACTEPVVVIEEPAEVETCEWLIPVGIELVNDYVYTLAETDVGAARGDATQLPTSILALNARGEELDRRAAELECDLGELNEAISNATEGIDSTDPVVRVFLETVRRGAIGASSEQFGVWVFVEGTVGEAVLAPVDGAPITLMIDGVSAGGETGCNSYYYPVSLNRGAWSWDEGSATITELPCLDDEGAEDSAVMGAEEAYVAAFELITAYTVDGDTLVLTGTDIRLRYIRSDGEATSAAD